MSDGRDDVSFVFEIGLLSIRVLPGGRRSVVHRRHEVRDYEQRPWRKKKDVTMLVAGMTRETSAFVELTLQAREFLEEIYLLCSKIMNFGPLDI